MHCSLVMHQLIHTILEIALSATLLQISNQWRSQPNSDARAQNFSHNIAMYLDVEPTFMKAQAMMHIQYVTLQAKTSLVHTSKIDTLEDH